MAILPFNIPNIPKPPPIPSAIAFSTAGLLIFLAIIFGRQPTGTPFNFTDSPFSFNVYCPVNSKQNLQKYSSMLTNL